MANKTPRVFISHASEDKERFVIDFATRLRARGVDAWVDLWEILPGDKLVRKIFDEGIGEADVMIIVISQHSINKPWVREELDAGVIKRISGQLKLIPVVIDKVPVPEPLQSTIWQTVDDVTNYEEEMQLIIRAIFDYRSAPPLGAPPTYTKNQINPIPELSAEDSLVLKTACELSIETDNELIMADALATELGEAVASEEALQESLEILGQGGFIQLQPETGGFSFFSLTPYGFNQYASAYLNDYGQLVEQILIYAINHEGTTNKAISLELQQPLMLIEYVLDILDNADLIRITRAFGRNTAVDEVTAKGKRLARQL